MLNTKIPKYSHIQITNHQENITNYKIEIDPLKYCQEKNIPLIHPKRQQLIQQLNEDFENCFDTHKNNNKWPHSNTKYVVDIQYNHEKQESKILGVFKPRIQATNQYQIKAIRELKKNTKTIALKILKQAIDN